jgi:DNA polymerase IV
MVHLWLPDFVVAVERQRAPDLEGQPVVVGGRPGGRGVVAAASHEARARGVVAGLPLADVPARCPNARFVEGTIGRYLEAADAVDELIRHDVDLVEWPGLDEAVFDAPRLGSTRSMVGIVEAVQQRVKARLGFDVACGVAASRVVARAAARLVAPRGVLCVLEGYERRFLAPLAVDLLEGVSPDVAARLGRAGIESMGELAALPPDVARQWLGRAASVLTGLARADDPRGVAGRPVPRTVWREAECADPRAGSDAGGLAGCVDALAASLGMALRGRGWVARAITLRLVQQGGRPVERTISLREATNLDLPLIEAVRDDVRALAPRVMGPLAVALVARGLLALPTRQLPLFFSGPRRAATAERPFAWPRREPPSAARPA